MDVSQLIIIILLILILVVFITFIILTLFNKYRNKSSNTGNYASYESNNDTNMLASSRFMRSANEPRTGIPVNIRTRNGTNPPQYATIGTIYNSDSSLILKLVGKEVYRGSQKWNYYAVSSDFNPNRLTVVIDGKECAKEYGCKELYDNDTVEIKEYSGKTFTVQLYPKETIQYIPY